MPSRPSQRDEFEVAVICALSLEYDAVYHLFDEIWDRDGREYGKVQGDPNQYTTGRIGGSNVVLVLLSAMGKLPAATAAVSLRFSFSGIKIALLVGVCGGAPQNESKGEILLGDVIISKKIMQYDYGRQYSGKFVPKNQAEGHPTREIQSLLAFFETWNGRTLLEEQATEFLQDLQKRGYGSEYRYPGAREDRLFQSDYHHKHHHLPSSPDACRICVSSADEVCDAALTSKCSDLECEDKYLVPRKRLAEKQQLERDGNVAAQQPMLHLGIIASGDAVLKSSRHRDDLIKATGAIAFEMEGAGLWHQLPCVVVKGVCDYADSHKQKGWQRFAAATAASMSKALLNYYGRSNPPRIPANPLPLPLPLPTQPESSTIITSRNQETSYIPLKENKNFVGRKDILDRVVELFSRDPHPRVALVGLGGTGKTQIALQLAYWIKQAALDHSQETCSVFWIPALSVATFNKACADISKMFPGSETKEEDPRERFRRYLSSAHSGKWLLVIDNADDPELVFGLPGRTRGIHQYIPSSSTGRVLFTTRNRAVAMQVAGPTSTIEVGEMSEEEAEMMFRKSITEENLARDENLASLLSTFAYHPFAIQQSVAYLNRTGISIGVFLDLFQKHMIDMLNWKFHDATRYEDTQYTTATLWHISFDQIRRDDPFAIRLLSFIFFIKPEAIPRAILPTGRSNEELSDALQTLQDYGILIPRGDWTYDMHGLVHIALRIWISEKGDGNAIPDTMKHLKFVFSAKNDNLEQHWRQIVPHGLQILQEYSDNQTGDLRELCRTTGLYLIHHRQSKAAIPNLERFCQFEEELPTEESRLGFSQFVLARAYFSNHQTKKSIKILESMSSTGTKVEIAAFATDIVPVVLAIAYMTYSEYPRTDKAIQALGPFMAITETMLSEERFHQLTLRYKLACDYMKDDKMKATIIMLELLVHIANEAAGELDIGQLESKFCLGVAYLNDGQYREAIKVLEHVVFTGRRILGETDEVQLWLQFTLGMAYFKDEQYKETIELLEPTFAVAKSVFCDDEAKTEELQVTLATAYFHDRRFEEAIKSLEPIITTGKNASDMDDAEWRKLQLQLTLAYLRERQYGEIIELLKPIISRGESTLDEDDVGDLEFKTLLAIAYLLEGRHKDAIGILEPAVAIWRRGSAEEDINQLETQLLLAIAYTQAGGRFNDAIDMIEYVVAEQKRVSGKGNLEKSLGLLALVRNGKIHDLGELMEAFFR